MDTADPDDVKSIVMPPSVVLKDTFSISGDKIECSGLAQKVLLSEEETQIWLDHLATVIQNSKRGAANAALTRKRKSNLVETNNPGTSKGTNNETSSNETSNKKSDETYCGVCKIEYNESETGFWIRCDL